MVHVVRRAEAGAASSFREFAHNGAYFSVKIVIHKYLPFAHELFGDLKYGLVVLSSSNLASSVLS